VNGLVVDAERDCRVGVERHAAGDAIWDVFSRTSTLFLVLSDVGTGGITALGEDCVMEADDRGSDLPVGHRHLSPRLSALLHRCKPKHGAHVPVVSGNRIESLLRMSTSVCHYYHRCDCTMMRCRSAEKNVMCGHHHFHFIVGWARKRCLFCRYKLLSVKVSENHVVLGYGREKPMY
jgi:hypothetical protein